jgi:hypothetical protein
MSSTQRPLVRPLKTGDAAERLQALRRAEELKLIAEETVDEDCRVVLLRLAQSFERLAAYGTVEPPPATPGRDSPWPLKLRASGVVPLQRSVPQRTG